MLHKNRIMEGGRLSPFVIDSSKGKKIPREEQRRKTLQNEKGEEKKEPRLPFNQRESSPFHFSNVDNKFLI